MVVESSSRKSFRGEIMMMRRGEDDSGMRTVESLRGRLLAEREASKAAKNEADLIAKRLEELERQLAKEIKSRNRAQKRLEYALKKLKSMKLSNLPESSQSSSEGWNAHQETETGSSGLCGSKGEVEETTSSLGLKDVAEDDGSKSSSGDSYDRVVSQEGSWSSVGTAHSRSKDKEPVRDEDVSDRHYQGQTVDAARRSSLQGDGPDASTREAYYDDALALVPVESMPHSASACLTETNNSTVQEVLLALRHVKEQLQHSMGRRAASLSSRREFYA